MRIAALYDIHGNLPALEAVLEDVGQVGVDLIVVGGDVVPGPMPRQCLALLAACQTPIRFVYGNGEVDVLSACRGEPLSRLPDQFHDVMRWVARQLSSEDHATIGEWPLTFECEIAGVGKALFCHATPRDDNEIFTRLTPDDRVKQMFEGVDADVVICGHTHMQFDRRLGDLRVVNAGSVGMPFGKPGAYWLLIGPDVSLRRTPYDLPSAASRLGTTHYPSDFDIANPPTEAQMLKVFEDGARQ